MEMSMMMVMIVDRLCGQCLPKENQTVILLTWFNEKDEREEEREIISLKIKGRESFLPSCSVPKKKHLEISEKVLKK